ncbi:MAG: efflux RND transporter periplasmic adaptor subunit [Phycisphaerae bacterium]
MLGTVALVFGGGAVCAAGEPALVADGHTRVEPLIGITAPAREASLGPIQSGRIHEVLVGEGDTVQEGDALFSFDDAVQRSRVAIARLDAQSTLGIELARERYSQAQRDYERLVGLQSGENASSKEILDAQGRAEIARLEFEIAKATKALLGLAYEREKAALSELTVRAPFSGYVAQQLKYVGESPDQREAVLRIMQLDPLHVTLDCPLSLAPIIELGDVVEVVPVEPYWTTRRGRVILKHRIADAASQTFRVKVAVENEDMAWMSGLKVLVKFPRARAAAGDVGVQGPPDPGVAVGRWDGKVARSGDRSQ